MRSSALLTSISLLSLFTLAADATGQTAGVFEIRFDDSGLTAQQQAELAPSLAATKSYWESIIIGYQPGVNLDGIDIEVTAAPIDGEGNTLATGGISGFIVDRGGFTFITDPQFNSSSGSVNIDTADFSSLLIIDVLKHEVAHALGFGILFDDNSLVSGPGQYTGNEGLTAYQVEFDSAATFVPLQTVTMDNGTVVSGGHLDENNPLSNAVGRAVADDLMTPIIENTTNANDPFSNFVSDTSLGILRDLGYDTVSTTYTEPEPILGDANLDRAVTFLDIAPFIQILSDGTYLEQADCNEDGEVNFLDISPFITFLTGG